MKNFNYDDDDDDDKPWNADHALIIMKKKL